MKAVIMAGGKGTRLSPVLKAIPKPMVPIGGKPLLEHQIECLKNNGIYEIILVIGYMGSVIREYFKTGEAFDVAISYYEEQTPLGTAGAFYYLKEQLKEEFILLFGDLFLDISFERMNEFHKRTNGFLTLYAHPNSHPCDSDLLVTGKDGCVMEWNPKTSVREEDYKNLVNAGIYLVSPKVLEQLKGSETADFEKDLLRPLISQKKVFAYQCSEYVKDIGTPERLAKVEQDYRNGICRRRNLNCLQKCIFLDRDGTINRHVGFLNRKEQMELEPDVAEAIRKINESEYLAVVITNQPVVARGECSFEELERIHNRLYTLLGRKGAYLDGLYYCPHHPDCGFPGERKELKINCNCRKPKTGLIDAAVGDFHISLEDSWFVGDTLVDVQTGLHAGVKTALIEKKGMKTDSYTGSVPNLTGENLLECVNKILRRPIEMTNEIKQYYNTLNQTIQNLNYEEINRAVGAIRAAYDREAVVYVFGNGGSAATASHFANDFNKGISESLEKKFRFICLCDNLPTITAVANDISYDDIFSFQLLHKLKKEDLLIAISGSGNSKNVLKAVQYGKTIGCEVIGITGYDGGELKKFADYHMHADIHNMQITEDIHMSFCHMMYQVFHETLH